MAVSAVTSSQAVQTIDAAATGFNGLTSEDFLKMMITQLQNQDPLEPTGNEELLNQISQMRSLQSNIELSDSLKSITGSQRLSTAASFIGQSVTGTVQGLDGSAREVTGIVERAFIKDGQGYIGLPDVELPVDNIRSVHAV